MRQNGDFLAARKKMCGKEWEGREIPLSSSSFDGRRRPNRSLALVRRQKRKEMESKEERKRRTERGRERKAISSPSPYSCKRGFRLSKKKLQVCHIFRKIFIMSLRHFFRTWQSAKKLACFIFVPMATLHPSSGMCGSGNISFPLSLPSLYNSVSFLPLPLRKAPLFLLQFVSGGEGPSFKPTPLTPQENEKRRKYDCPPISFFGPFLLLCLLSLFCVVWKSNSVQLAKANFLQYFPPPRKRRK